MYLKFVSILISLVGIIALSLCLHDNLKMAIINKKTVNSLYIGITCLSLILVCQIYSLYRKMLNPDK